MQKNRQHKTTARRRREQEDIDQFALANITKPISTDITLFRALRFNGTLSGNSATSGFTFQQITNSMLVAASTTTLVTLFEVVKIKEIRLHAYTTGRVDLATAYTITLTWSGGQTLDIMGDQRSKSVSGMGTTPAFLRSRPRRQSLPAMFNYGSANRAFAIFSQQTQPSNAELSIVLELDVLFRTNEQLVPVTASSGGTALSPGEWYYRGLDAQPIATTAWPPMGVANVA